MKNIILFALFCIAWGTTWIAIKYGVDNAPPILFAGSRFFVAGLLLLVYFIVVGKRSVSIELLKNKYLYITSAMVISFTFGLIFWGEHFVSAGVTAIVVQGFIPILFTFFAILYKIDKFSLRHMAITILGLLGLYFLFTVKDEHSTNAYIFGIFALIGGTIFYTWGSVILKIKITKNNIIELSAYQNIIGGLVLLVSSFILEKNDILVGNYILDDIVLYSWAYLVIIGSIVGFTLYLHFLSIWDVKKVGLYTFITPVIALIVDKYMFATKLSSQETIGLILILCSILFSLVPHNVKS